MKIGKPADQFTGITLEDWWADVNNITWAQQEPRFRVMLSVILNESRLAHETAAGCSGERAFGRVEGYHMALNVMRGLGQRPPKPPKEPEPFPGEPIVEKDKEPFD